MDDDPKDRPAAETGGSSGWGVDWRAIGQYAVIGFVFPLAMVIGFLAGRWIGGWFGHPGGGSAVGLLLGIFAAFYNVYEVVRRLNAEDAEGGGGEPPER